MKKLLLALSFTLASLISYAQTSEKVVVNQRGEVKGRYIGENSTSYHIGVQDDVWIPKKGMKVVTYSAKNGQGWVYTDSEGAVNMRQSPNPSAPVIAKLINEDFVPTCYKCLGLENGWFKIKAKGKIGYVKASLFKWDSIQAF